MSIPPSLPKAYRALAVLADTAGWTIIRQRRHNHFAWMPPGSTVIVVTDCSASDYRTFPNNVALLRRAGLQIPRRGPRPKRRRETA